MTPLQKAIAGATLVTVVASSLYQLRQNSEMYGRILALQQEQQSLKDRLATLQEIQEQNAKQVPAGRNSAQSASQEVIPAMQPPPNRFTPKPVPSAGLEDEIDRACSQQKSGAREAAMNRIITGIQASDIPRALAHLATKPGMNGVETPLFSELSCKWGESDPNTAAAWAATLSDTNAQKEAFLGILGLGSPFPGKRRRLRRNTPRGFPGSVRIESNRRMGFPGSGRSPLLGQHLPRGPTSRQSG